MVTQQVGLLTTTVTNSGFLTSMYVVFTPLLTVILLRKKPHAIVWPAALIALGGIYFLSGGNLSGLTKGDGLTLVSVVFWSFQLILIGIFVRSSGRPFALCAVQFSVCALLGLLGGAVFETVHW